MKRRTVLLGIAASLSLPAIAKGGKFYLNPKGLGVIYGERSGIIRRTVCTDDPETLAGHIGPGERMLVLKRPVLASKYNDIWMPDPSTCRHLVAKECGFEPESDRCVVIDDATGEIVNVVMADPWIDKIPGHTLFQDAHSVPGSVPGP